MEPKPWLFFLSFVQVLRLSEQLSGLFVTILLLHQRKWSPFLATLVNVSLSSLIHINSMIHLNKKPDDLRKKLTRAETHTV